MIRTIVLWSFILGFYCSIEGQEIVEVTYASTVTTVQIQFLSLSVGLNTGSAYDVDIYKVRYTTTGSDMQKDTASGLFYLPVDFDGAMPLACYQHGTTDGRSDVPSNFGAFYEMGILLATHGMATVAPDYLGMGSSRGFHPYVHAETEATAAVDLLKAMQTYLSDQQLLYNGQLFITGYSQGGHAAMALHKYIEEVIPEQFEVTASLPMSGPYSISGVMQDLAFADTEFLYPSFLVYSARGLREVYPDIYRSESELYRPEFLEDIDQFVSDGEGLNELNLDLIDGLLVGFGSVIPRNLYKDSILNILSQSADHPLNVALRESDVYDWTPIAPVLMLYCEADDQVPFRNSILADSIMNANGAMDVQAQDVSGGRDRTHTECALPALNVGIPWLISFMQVTPTVDIAPIDGLRLYPNPVSDRLVIETEASLQKVTITDISGRIYFKQQIAQQRSKSIDVSQWTEGMYLVHISADDRTNVVKLIVQH